MYNGIGLQTPRGSGSNGYVQRNFAAVRPRKDNVQYKKDEDVLSEEPFFKPPNPELVKHEMKRRIEVKCFELRDELEEKGHPEGDIERKVSNLREELLQQIKEEVFQKDTFMSQEQKRLQKMEEKQKKFRDALGLDKKKSTKEADKKPKKYDLVKSSSSESEDSDKESVSSNSPSTSDSSSSDEETRKSHLKKVKGRPRSDSGDEHVVKRRKEGHDIRREPEDSHSRRGESNKGQGNRRKELVQRRSPEYRHRRHSPEGNDKRQQSSSGARKAEPEKYQRSRR